MKRLIDVTTAFVGLVILAPFLAVFALLIWFQDRRWPLYSPLRVGRHGRPYRMHKLRSMVQGADRNRVDSTANNDPRITPLGRLIRGLKLDEFPQLWNVLVGDMSLVGPRPNVARETALYTSEEQRLLSVRPGITDISSIVFSDLGAILDGHPDANLAYNQLVRPYKSRLGLLYVDQGSVGLDLRLILLTLLASFNRPGALRLTAQIVQRLHAPPFLVEVATRQSPLRPLPPPGSDHIVTQRSS